MKVNGPGRPNSERKKSLAAGEASMAILLPIAGFKGRTFELLFLNRADLNFCVRSTPLLGANQINKCVMTKIQTVYLLSQLVPVNPMGHVQL